jgi:cytochrome c556
MAGAIALALGATGAAFAEDMKPADIVRARVDRFREIGAAFKTINDELKKPRPLKVMLTSAGSNIASNAREIQPMFPEGTGPSSGLKTKAKMEVWSQRKAFDSKFARLVAEADKMNAATRSGDFDAMRAQAKALGAVCQDCHKTFRTKDD